MSAARRDYYQVLGVRPEASGAEIRASFLAKARLLHPDQADAAARDAAEAAFRELTQAYETLADATRRQEYDARRRIEQVWRPSPVATHRWTRLREELTGHWGVDRFPWYSWLVLGPALLGIGAVILAQFFFHYTFVIGMVVIVPLIVTWYAYELWPPLALIVLAPTLWLWGFLIQGTWRNRRRESRDRTGPAYRQSL